jgi:parvulin-like peptidyl-prolyl isomerase
MMDPMIAAQIGQNPMAQTMMAAIQAHIAEHLAFAYRRKIEEQMGVPLPPPNEKLPEDVEVQLSRLVAQAGAQLLQLNMANAQQQQAQQQAQDPLIQMQQAELQIKAQEVQRKTQKDQAEVALAQQRLKIDSERIQAENTREQARLIAANKMSEQKIKADVITKLTKG